MYQEIPVCTHCAQVMTNPLCPYCFSQHVLFWLKDKNLTNQQVKAIVKELRAFIMESGETPAEMECIKCGQEQVDLCTFCAINKTKDIIAKHVVSTPVKQAFSQDFNAQLWRGN